MTGNLKKYVQKVSDILELIAAVLVLFGIVLSIFSLIKDFTIFRELLEAPTFLRNYLEDIFVIVIGIEFLQMLCRPNSDNIIEVLVFLVARHMIVTETTSYENFISVVSVVLLCVLRRYMHISKQKLEKDAVRETTGLEKDVVQEDTKSTLQRRSE